MNNRVSDSNIQRNITYDSDLHTNFTVDTITSLQGEISNKMARYINREYSSKRNDLQLCLQGEKNYQRLAEYLEILEEIKYCDSCFCEWSPSEIVSAVYFNINKL